MGRIVGLTFKSEKKSKEPKSEKAEATKEPKSEKVPEGTEEKAGPDDNKQD